MKRLFFFFLVISCITQMHADEITNVPATKTPDRIMLTIPGNPATSLKSIWRTVYSNTMIYKFFTIDGGLYDAFSIVKNSEGVNRILEDAEVQNIEQRVEIPKKEIRKGIYNKQELQKYREKFE